MLVFESQDEGGWTYNMKTRLNGSHVSLNDSLPGGPPRCQSTGKAAEDRYVFTRHIYFIRHGVLGELTALHVCHQGLMTASCKGK